jgi:hypothetical protein
MAVRVVRAVGGQVGPRERLPLLAGGVLHRGIRLEQHVALQPVPEDGGNEALLLRLDRLALDDGGEGQELVERQTAGAGLGEQIGRDLRPHALDHAGEDLLGSHAAHELIRVRE